MSCHTVHYENQGNCIVCHAGNPDSERKNIAHHRLIPGRFARAGLQNDTTVLAGQRLLEQYACRRCHRTGNKGNILAANLDTSVQRITAEAIEEAIINPAGGMPRFKLNRNQRNEVVTALRANASLSGETSKKLKPQIRHFTADSRTEHTFSKKCGSCHRIVTTRLGLLGNGDIGPDLSGLLTEWYPHSFSEDSAWSGERLKKWLHNPRDIRRWALMQPVEITDEEFRKLLVLFEN